MATRRSYLERPSYIYLGEERQVSSISSDTQFELDEAEIWNSNEFVPGEAKKQTSGLRPVKKPGRSSAAAAADRRPKGSSSLPVNIPDWSKILPGEYAGKNRWRGNGGNGEDVGGGDDDDDDDDEDGRLPPHEYLARTRMASLSVHEGIGRTLKGRDLRRVRNAIWKQTGFED